MQVDCPKCGDKLFAGELTEAGACPSCGHQFSKGEFVTPSSHRASSDGDGTHRIPMGWLWAMLLLLPGAMPLLALIASESGSGMPFGAFGGFVLAGILSCLIGARSTGSHRVLMTIGAFVVSLVVGGFVYFGGCMLVLMKTGLH
jgi:hypothetical protein